MKSWLLACGLMVFSATCMAEGGRTIPAPAVAQSPDSVPGAPVKRLVQGGVCANSGGDAMRRWSCFPLGEVTIRQIYERGWRVVAMSEGYVVIEEQ
jgi:hypothetical protein